MAIDMTYSICVGLEGLRMGTPHEAMFLQSKRWEQAAGEVRRWKESVRPGQVKSVKVVILDRPSDCRLAPGDCGEGG